MKKIIFILICTIFCSCSVTTLSGTITAYNHNGEVLKKWEDVTIQEEVGGTITNNSIKTFGVNFYDKKTKKYVILGHSIPYIIEYETKTNPTLVYQENPTERQAYKQSLIDSWTTLAKREKELKSKLKNAQRGSNEYNEIKQSYISITAQMEKIAYILQRDFFYDVYFRVVL